MSMYCTGPNIKITEGNAFALILPLKSRHFVSDTPIDEEIDCTRLEDVRVFVGSEEWQDFELKIDGVNVSIPATMARDTYNVELTATYDGIAIRAGYFECFTIVKWSYQADAQNYIPASPIAAEAAYIVAGNYSDEELDRLKEELRAAIADADDAKAEAIAKRDEYIERIEEVNDIARQGDNEEATNTAILAAVESMTAVNRAKMLNRGGELKDYTIFFDIDGTILYAYTQEEIQQLTELPEPYVHHDRLTFDRWLYSLDELKAAGSWRDVGAHYYPTDGFGELELDYRDSTYLTPHIGVRMLDEDGLIVEWGDGSVETLAPANEFDLRHTYANEGKYLMRYKQASADKNIYGIYVYSDTKKHTVGRCVYPTNCRCISCSTLTGQTENTTYRSAQGVGSTLIEELVLPYNCSVADYSGSSGLFWDMPLLKAVSSCCFNGYFRGCENTDLNGTILPKAIFVAIKDYRNIQSFGSTPNYVRSFFLDYASSVAFPSIRNANIERIGARMGIPSILCAWPPLQAGKLKSIPPVELRSWWNDGGIWSPCLEVAPDFSMGGFWSRGRGFGDCYKIRDWGETYNNNGEAYGISNNGFIRNYSLCTFRAGATTPSIGASAFADCWNLGELHLERSVVVDGNVTSLANVNAFTNCPSHMKIYVPADSVAAYKVSTNWATYSDQIFAEQ